MVAETRGGRYTEGFWRGLPTYEAVTGPFRRRFGRRRRVAALAALLLAVVAVPTAWRAVRLAGLPDVGEPFDAKAFRAETIPDERNAFVLYRRAVARYRPLDLPGATGWPRDVRTDWADASPEVRAWLEGNREALALLREGSERPDALDPSQFGPTGGQAESDSMRSLLGLGLLEASRLESQGDMDGARGWYRALLRTAHHLGLRARTFRCADGLQWRGAINARWVRWAADPRTTPAQLRRAIDDVNACEALAPSEAYTVKFEYLSMNLPAHGRGGLPVHWTGPRPPIRVFGVAVPLPVEDRLRSLARFWRAEPERARRVARLVTANRLAYYALPPDRRPNPEPSVLLCALYPLGPDAPPAARALNPKALGAWIYAAKDLDLVQTMWVENLQRQESASRQALLDALTSELDRLNPPAVPTPAPAPDPVP